MRIIRFFESFLKRKYQKKLVFMRVSRVLQVRLIISDDERHSCNEKRYLAYGVTNKKDF